MLFCSNFYTVPFFFMFVNFEYHVRTLENLIKLSLHFKIFLLRADAYFINAIERFYGFRNMQKTELYML